MAFFVSDTFQSNSDSFDRLLSFASSMQGDPNGRRLERALRALERHLQELMADEVEEIFIPTLRELELRLLDGDSFETMSDGAADLIVPACELLETVSTSLERFKQGLLNLVQLGGHVAIFQMVAFSKRGGAVEARRLLYGPHLGPSKAVERNEKIETSLSDADTKEWELVITMSSESLKASVAGFLIWTISEALEFVDGVRVELIDWGRGSLWARLKIVFGSDRAKLEAKQVLQEARKGIMAKHFQKPVEEVGRLIAEREKIEAERDESKAKMDAAESAAEARLRRQLELEKLRIEVEERRLNLIDKQLETAKNIANLVREGLVFADPVKLEINGLPFLALQNGKVEGGVPIDELDERPPEG